MSATESPSREVFAAWDPTSRNSTVASLMLATLSSPAYDIRLGAYQRFIEPVAH
jgi:hypothetical protein